MSGPVHTTWGSTSHTVPHWLRLPLSLPTMQLPPFPDPHPQLFVTSKVSPYQQGTEAAAAACEASLRLLGTYIDLMLVRGSPILSMPLLACLL